MAIAFEGTQAGGAGVTTFLSTLPRTTRLITRRSTGKESVWVPTVRVVSVNTVLAIASRLLEKKPSTSRPLRAANIFHIYIYIYRNVIPR